jgi:hypothetical protein
MNYDHLTVIVNPETGLLHGAIYRFRGMPSGDERMILSGQTSQGYETAVEAAKAIHDVYPDRDPVDQESCEKIDAAIEAASYLVRGTVVACAVPKSERGVRSDSRRLVEASYDGYPVAVSLTTDQIDTLVRAKRLKPVASSGNDPNLSARYDEYVVTKSGRGVSAEPVGSLAP